MGGYNLYDSYSRLGSNIVLMHKYSSDFVQLFSNSERIQYETEIVFLHSSRGKQLLLPEFASFTHRWNSYYQAQQTGSYCGIASVCILLSCLVDKYKPLSQTEVFDEFVLGSLTQDKRM